MSFFHRLKLFRLFTQKIPGNPSSENPIKPQSQKSKSNPILSPNQDPLSIEFQKFIQEQANKQIDPPSTVHEKITSNKKLSSIAEALDKGQVIDLGEIDDEFIKEFEDVDKDIEGEGGKEMDDMIDSILKEAEIEEGREKNEVN